MLSVFKTYLHLAIRLKNLQSSSDFQERLFNSKSNDLLRAAVETERTVRCSVHHEPRLKSYLFLSLSQKQREGHFPVLFKDALIRSVKADLQFEQTALDIPIVTAFQYKFCLLIFSNL